MSDRKIICQNEYGSQIQFSYDFPFFLKSTEGLHEMSASITTVKSAFGNGSNYVGTSINDRSIILNFEFIDNLFERRQTIYNNFSLGSKGTLFYYDSHNKYKIDYYVESVVVASSGYPRECSVSLKCPYPFFSDVEETIISLSNWIPALSFPFELSEEGFEFGYKNISSIITIDNPSKINLGMKIIFIASDKVVNPRVINMITREEILINYAIKAGEKIIITTILNQKKIEYVNLNNQITDITYTLQFGSKYLQIGSGSNTFKSTAEIGEEYMTTEIHYSNIYPAV